MMMNTALPWRTQDVGVARAIGHLPSRSSSRKCNSTKERSVFQSTNLKGFGGLKSVLTADMKMQNLDYAQLVFSLAVV